MFELVLLPGLRGVVVLGCEPDDLGNSVPGADGDVVEGVEVLEFGDGVVLPGGAVFGRAGEAGACDACALNVAGTARPSAAAPTSRMIRMVILPMIW